LRRIIGVDNSAMHKAWRWDVFCRVVDNHGDVGVCWRLCCQLVEQGHHVRLWVDDASALAWMAPPNHVGVEVRPWGAAQDDLAPCGDVLMEAFGCNAPDSVLHRMAQAHREAATHGNPSPVWINLEYLSAEPYAARSHGLPSPRSSGPAAGLTQWFFYPGFTAVTGGLLRGSDTPALPRVGPVTSLALTAAAGLPIHLHRGERAVSLFTYAHANTVWLLHALAACPTLLLTAPGSATDSTQAFLAQHPQHRATLRHHPLPWLAQPRYDALLDTCDLNVVRGEDSLVRAVWAGRPFLWNIYAQGDGAHAPKLNALLDTMGAQASLGPAWRRLNSLHTPNDAPVVIDQAWVQRARDAVTPWWQGLRQQDDLLTRLLRFVEAKRRLASPAQEAPP
jgi:uncharacterized repeat protein (TIGR03837 family)